MRPPHALVVGGSGMLRGVCLELARKGWNVSVVGRRHAPLSSLAREAAGLAGAILPVPADYSDAQELAGRIRAQAMAHGPISMAVCWIHSTAPGAAALVAEMIAEPRRPPAFVHVLGSASADPSRLGQPGGLPVDGIRYQRVILGFIVERGRSRWLTDEEICAGILAAVESGEAEQTVGTTSPWEAHP